MQEKENEILWQLQNITTYITQFRCVNLQLALQIFNSYFKYTTRTLKATCEIVVLTREFQLETCVLKTKT